MSELTRLKTENESLRRIVRAYLRSPDRGQEERLRVKARRALEGPKKPVTSEQWSFTWIGNEGTVWAHFDGAPAWRTQEKLEAFLARFDPSWGGGFTIAGFIPSRGGRA